MFICFCRDCLWTTINIRISFLWKHFWKPHDSQKLNSKLKLHNQPFKLCVRALYSLDINNFLIAELHSESQEANCTAMPIAKVLNYFNMFRGPTYIGGMVCHTHMLTGVSGAIARVFVSVPLCFTNWENILFKLLLHVLLFSSPLRVFVQLAIVPQLLCEMTFMIYYKQIVACNRLRGCT